MRVYIWVVFLLAILSVVSTTSPSEPASDIKDDNRRNRGRKIANTANSVDKPTKNKGRKGNKKNKCNAELVSYKPETKTCHSEAVRKCGRNFISKLRKRQGPDGKVPYKDKCRLRETFLNCVTDSRKKPCRPRGHVIKASHRAEMKRVTAHLWSTRGCVLGIDA